MRDFPALPDVADVPESLFDGGHLWVQEWVPGGLLRFRLQPSGLLSFGDDRRAFGDGIPLGYRHAVSHVRESFDRQRLRDALDDVSEAVFFGVATRHEGLDYDWDRTPSFLGVDVWTPDGGFRPPDAAEALFEELGLAPVTAVAKELRADSFDPASYALPESAWRDGEAAGVLVRNKTGDRGRLVRGWERPEAYRGDESDLAAELATDARIEAAAARLERENGAATVDAVTDRVVAVAAREAYARAFDDSLDEAAFRSAVAERVSRALGA
ncbi:hypothetical protein [Halobacterium jilantaiense]|uniref:RNA ligase domain-containing protein n=1 Tax=Halobacterium jilantaiense TaxID=355548 RepID=A0A1I0MLJ9_9EURY|nr:hypothetical protein [Halobacterium jilantaiense]SEV89222.1 hypothetical protein SAMN04487945_0176 [Halobacterium jilantaiense]